MRHLRHLLTPLLALVLLAGIIPWRIACTARACEATSPAARTAGALLAAAGLAIFLRAGLLLAGARAEPPSPSRPGGRLIVRGPYRRIRNPLYTGILLVTLGEAVAQRSPALFVWTGILAILLHLVVVFVEEPALRRRFGDLHDVYRDHVPRWIPRRGGPDAP